MLFYSDFATEHECILNIDFNTGEVKLSNLYRSNSGAVYDVISNVLFYNKSLPLLRTYINTTNQYTNDIIKLTKYELAFLHNRFNIVNKSFTRINNFKPNSDYWPFEYGAYNNENYSPNANLNLVFKENIKINGENGENFINIHFIHNGNDSGYNTYQTVETRYTRRRVIKDQTYYGKQERKNRPAYGDTFRFIRYDVISKKYTPDMEAWIK